MPTHPAASRITAGSTLPALALSVVDGTTIAIPDGGGTVHLQLRRFAGCPFCNLHLQSFARRAEEIAQADIREIVVFHSSIEELHAYKPDLPFTLVADPEKRIYRQLGVESAPRSMLSPGLLARMPRALLRVVRELVRPPHRLPNLTPEGGLLGLPADFLIAGDGRVLAVKYGEHAYDQWTVDELLSSALPRVAS